MADNETKSTMKEFKTNDLANYYSGITSITVNGKNAYELKGKFLDDLHDNNDNHDEVFDDGFFDFEEANNDDKQEISEIFRIETNLFNYETPLCMKFNEFNYLLKVDPELFTYVVVRTMTYDDYENEFNDELEDPWYKGGVPYEIGNHICEPFHFKNGKAKWPTCSSNEDGFCNGGELSGMVRVSYMTYFQDHEWYNDFMDGSLKNEAPEQKPVTPRKTKCSILALPCTLFFVPVNPGPQTFLEKCRISSLAISWVMGVVWMEKGVYLVDFECNCCEKRGGKRAV
uniref:Uncharacterized protein n=1 Tax=Tanacetum cinerariifolium TaxID=118510 RepID=A0A6L2MKA5_TANCI|nr:hypothetical protein [Tanacetum cinerariifolium]